MNDFQIYLSLYINYLDISPPAQACTGIAGGKEGGSFRVGRVFRPLCRPPFSAWKMMEDGMDDACEAACDSTCARNTGSHKKKPLFH